MPWQPGYAVGVESIDTQHKTLVGLIDSLQSAIRTGKGNEQIGTTIKTLIDYTHTHFTDEEAFAKSIGYADLTRHQELHKALISEIKNILIHIRSGNKYNPIELVRFLNNWLCKHILSEDMKIGRAVAIKKFSAVHTTEKASKPQIEITMDTEFESLKKEEDQALRMKIDTFCHAKAIIQNAVHDNSPVQKQGALNVLKYLIDKERVSEDLFINDMQSLLLSIDTNDILSAIEDEEEKKATAAFMTLKGLL